MSGARISADLRGFGVPTRGFSLANLAANTGAALTSSYTEAGPRAGGTGTSSNARSRLRISASGQQDTDLVAEVEAAGAPGTTRITYRPTSDSTDRGWSPPCWPGRADALQFGATAYTLLGSATIPSNQNVAILYASATTYYAGRWSAAAWTATGSDSIDTVGATVAGAICVLPVSERQVALAAKSSATNLDLYYSDDAGVTWAAGGSAVLGTVWAGTISRCRLLALDESTLALFVQTSTTLYQYVSRDGGASFSLVDSSTASDYADAALLPSGRIVVVTVDTSGTSYPVAHLLGSPDDDWSDTSTVITVAQTLTEVSIVAEPDGVLWVLGRLAGSGYLWRSTDEGATWSAMATGWFASGSAADYPTILHPAASAGAVLLVHQLVTTSAWSQGAGAGSILCWQLGGWGSIGPGSADAGSVDLTRYGVGPHVSAGAITAGPWGYLPDVAAWTDDYGAGTVAMVDAALGPAMRITTAASNRSFSTSTGTKTSVWARVFVGSRTGGSLTEPGLTLRASTGATSYQITVRFSATHFRVADSAGTSLCTDVAHADTSTLELVVRVTTTGSATLHYRTPGPGTAYTAVTLTGPVAGVVATGAIGFGASVTSSSTIDWQAVYGGWETITGGDVAIRGISSYPVRGHVATSYPYPIDRISAAGATFLAASGGAGYTGDTHTIPVAYDYPVEALFTPSPSRPWRSTGTTETIFAWTPAEGKGTRAGPAMFVALLGVNFATAYLEASTGGAWTTVGTYDGTRGFSSSLSLTSSVTGHQVRPNGSTTGTAGRYLPRNEYIGGTVVSGGVYREIIRHSGGVWAPTASSGAKPAIFDCDPSLANPTAGAATLIAPSGVLVVHNLSGGTGYTHWRLRIPSQTTAHGDFRIGALAIGEIALVGRQWGRGWSIDSPLGSERTEDGRGSIRRRKLADPADTYTIAWADGIDSTQIRTTSDLDWLSAKAGYPQLVNRDDVVGQLRGLLDDLDSGELPIVVLPSIPDAATADSTTIVDRTLFLYGTLDSGLSIEHVTGDEGESELYRVASIAVQRLV